MRKTGTVWGNVGRNWHTGLLLLVVVYFSFHAFHGQGSIQTLRSLKEQEQSLQLVANEVAARRAYMEQRTAALSGDKIDPDMLEEQVRRHLGFTHPDEVIILQQ